MQDKLKNILKKFSFASAEPDKDWKKIFWFFMILLVFLVVWSVYFYYSILGEIAAAEASQPVAVGQVAEGEDKLKETIKAFNARATQNASALSGGAYSLPGFVLEDPSRP